VYSLELSKHSGSHDPIPAEYWCVILGATGLVATFVLLLVVLLLVAKLLKRDKKAAIWVHHH